MIDIVERPSETGKLIHLNPRDWKCPRQVASGELLVDQYSLATIIYMPQ